MTARLMNLPGRLVSWASGAGASNPLSARIENTMPARMPPKWCGELLMFSGALKCDPCPGWARNVKASASMIRISMPPNSAVVRIDSLMP